MVKECKERFKCAVASLYTLQGHLRVFTDSVFVFFGDMSMITSAFDHILSFSLMFLHPVTELMQPSLEIGRFKVN